MRVPASLLAVPLLAGAAAGLLLYDSAPPFLAMAAVSAALLCLLAGISALLDRSARECTTLIVVGCGLCGVSLGLDAAGRAYAPPLAGWHRALHASHPVVLEGTLREDAALTPFGASLLMDVVRVAGVELGTPRAVRGVRLTVAGTMAANHVGEWRGGRSIRVTATLRAPSVYYTPGVPDDRRALARRGIVLLGSIKSAALVELLERGPPVAEAAGATRGWARARLAWAVGEWSRRSGAIAAAILIGDRTGLSAEDERRLQEAGTYHVVAISGGNIAIFALLLLGGMRLLRMPDRAASACTILALIFYGQVVVPAASVSRAITAATVYLAGRMIDQSGPALNVLAVAAGVAIAWRPTTVFDPAFLLSFGATLGILLGVPRLARWRPRASRGAAGAAGVLFATVAAEIALAPIAATLFSRITVAGLLLNFAAIPLMTAVQAGSLLVLALGSVDAQLARLAGRGVHAAAYGLVESARLVELAPWLSQRVLPPAWWTSAVYYSAIVWALATARFRRAAGVVAACTALAMLAGVPALSRDRVVGPAGQVTVGFLDVGQGDATVLLLPDGRAVLVDAGGLPFGSSSDGQESAGFDVGARVIAPALRALGVRRLDTLVITHGDPDHLGGALSVLRELKPRAIWEGIPVPPHHGLRALEQAALQAGAEWRTVQRGDVVRVAGVELRILHPPPPGWERQRVRNEDSVVLDLRYGHVSIVLPGDIGREGETAIASVFTPARLTILKAPHHGSASSSTPVFLSAVRPSVVIFSAGRASPFGHPAPSVVARYAARGTRMYSTAEDGTVLLETDGRVVRIEGWRGGHLTLNAR